MRIFRQMYWDDQMHWRYKSAVGAHGCKTQGLRQRLFHAAYPIRLQHIGAMI